MLTDYYLPLTPLLLLFCLISLIYLDAIGVFINDRFHINAPNFLRPSLWIAGAGVVIFFWFIVHFFAPFKTLPVLLTLTPIAIITIPSYLFRKKWNSLLSFFKLHWFPIVPLLALSPILFVKSSLPPYTTDEMAYHFMPPYEANLATWTEPQDFKTSLWIWNNRFYPNLPKEMDVFLNLPFAITHTYAPSRLLHFFIFYSGVWSIFAWVKSRFSHSSAIIFLLLSLFLHHDLLIMGTSGYIDYSTASITMLGLVLFIEFILERDIGSLSSGAIFWGLLLGSKLPGLATFMLSALILAFWVGPKKLIRSLNPKIVITLLLTLVVFGGFWYIKSWIYTGNPIYPFVSNLFHCKFEECLDTQNFFGNWTTPISLNTLPQLVIGVTRGNSILMLFMVPALLLIALSKSKKAILITIWTIFNFLLIFPLINLFSGFVDRYFYYLPLLITLIVSIPFSLKFTNPIKTLFLYTFIGIFLLVVINITFRTTKIIYSTTHYISRQEIDYTLGKTNIINWLNDRHKNNGDLLKWCGEGEVRELLLPDEMLIHETDDGPTHIFNLYCKFIFPEFSAADPLEELKMLVDNDRQFFFADRKTCRAPRNTLIPRELDLPTYKDEIRNLLLCSSDKVVKNVYSFNLKKAKELVKRID